MRWLDTASRAVQCGRAGQHAGEQCARHGQRAARRGRRAARGRQHSTGAAPSSSVRLAAANPACSTGTSPPFAPRRRLDPRPACRRWELRLTVPGEPPPPPPPLPARRYTLPAQIVVIRTRSMAVVDEPQHNVQRDAQVVFSRRGTNPRRRLTRRRECRRLAPVGSFLQNIRLTDGSKRPVVHCPHRHRER